MKYALTLTLSLCFFYSTAQTYQVRFSECLSGCTSNAANDPLNAAFSYDVWEEYATEDVVSDYSMRNLSSSKWHKGVDYSDNGQSANADRGDAILAVADGNIARLKVTGSDYKYLTTSGAAHFGYGHIFRNGNPNNPPGYQKSGKFILKRCDIPFQMHYAIINLESCIAYSDLIGAEVTIPGLSTSICSNTLFYTTVEVSEGGEIAPLGNSGTMQVHLHLYKFKTTAGFPGVGGSPINNANTGDPLEDVLHAVPPSYDVTMKTKSAPMNNVIIKYPGTKKQGFAVRSSMVGATTSGDRILGGTMNLDKVEIGIRPSSGADFFLIQGPLFDSKIHLGAKNATDIYPGLITTRFGSWTKTGQKPFAYSNPGNKVYDEFYYTDFLTRIHKDDPGDPDGDGKRSSKIMLTDVPQNARYNDDCYDVRASVVDVRSNFSSGTAIPFTLDNFMPYLEYITISQNSSLLVELYREGREGTKSANDGSIHNIVMENRAYNTSEPVLVTVQTSEPMTGLTLHYNGSSFPMQNQDEYTWDVVLTNVFDDCPKFRFTGKDKADNGLINVYEMSNKNGTDKVEMPARKASGSGAGAWYNYPGFLGEDFVEFCFGDCEPVGGINASNTEKSFIVEECEDLFNMTYSFTHIGCGQSSGFITLDIPQSTYFIDWTDGLGNPLPQYIDQVELTGLGTGTYCYTINYEDCCFTENCITIMEENVADNIIMSFSEGVISGTQDLHIEIAENAAFPVYVEVAQMPEDIFICGTLIQASNPTDDCSGLIMGREYCITYTDDEGCSTEVCFVVEGQTCPDILDVNLVSLSPSCDGQQNGSITIEVPESGCESYTVEWDNGATGTTLIDLSEGTYCVTVTDDCGTSAEECFDVPVILDNG